MANRNLLRKIGSGIAAFTLAGSMSIGNVYGKDYRIESKQARYDLCTAASLIEGSAEIEFDRYGYTITGDKRICSSNEWALNRVKDFADFYGSADFKGDSFISEEEAKTIFELVLADRNPNKERPFVP